MSGLFGDRSTSFMKNIRVAITAAAILNEKWSSEWID